MVKELSIVKVPRSDDILDKNISFAPLQNLHLDLIEVKKKLKKGLPALSIKKTLPVPTKVETPQPVLKQAASISNGADGDDDIPDEIELELEADGDDETSMLKELGGGDGDIISPSVAGVATAAAIAGDVEGGTVAPTEGEPDPHEGMTPEEIEAHDKEEYIWRFRILKKQYKTRDIPVYNRHDDLMEMKTTYDSTIKEIHLENNVDSYRTYLVGGFMVMEFVFTNWVGADLTGFTTQQMAMMDKYDIMLIELGERSYNRWGTGFPIEIRLIGFILLQAGLFYLGKIIADKAGVNIATIFKGLTGQGIPVTAPHTENGATAGSGTGTGQPVKKMRGPSIKVSDIKREAPEKEEDEEE
jgi:hypothetical protein